jgi:hypothetical protein
MKWQWLDGGLDGGRQQSGREWERNIMPEPPYFVSIRKNYVIDSRGVAAISVS